MVGKEVKVTPAEGDVPLDATLNAAGDETHSDAGKTQPYSYPINPGKVNDIAGTKVISISATKIAI